MTLRITISIVLWLAFARCAAAQNGGFDILTIGPNSEALGLSETVSANLLGASDIYSNPANLNFEPSSSINADYSLWIAGLRNAHFAVHFKRDKSSLAFGLLASEADDFQLRQRPGPTQGSFAVSYLSLAGAYAYKINNLSAGITFQYLHEELYIYDANGYAVSAGFSSQWLEERLRISAGLQNMGRLNNLNATGTQLPSLFRTGFEVELFEFRPSGNKSLPLKVSVLADYVQALETGESISRDRYFNMGLNIGVAEHIDLRAGYKTGDTDRPFSFGTGINLDMITVNYAIIPFKTGFGTVHSIGLSYRF